MDPSRISLEDDRFGLIGISFRPQNRATYVGRDGDDNVWAIGVVVGDEDEIQTVEIDDHGAKSSRMLTPGEVFEGLEVLAASGKDSHLIVGTLTLLGMDLRASGAASAAEFAELLRAAADDRNWRLPLHLIGQPRDLQLSVQGREILRQTAASIERDGQARTTLTAAQRLELSAQALDSIRRRIARKSLQAYRMHGRWYVVLDNLARSRSAEMNGTSSAAVPATSMLTEAPPSPFEEVPSDADMELERAASTQVAVEEQPFVADEMAVEPELHVDESTPSMAEPEPVAASEPVEIEEAREVPSEDDLAAFVAQETEPGLGAVLEEIPQELVAQEPGDESLESEVVAEQLAAHDALVSGSGFATDETAVATSDMPEDYWSETVSEQPIAFAEPAEESSNHVDQLVSETILEQFIMTELGANEPAPLLEHMAGSAEPVLAAGPEDLIGETTGPMPAGPEAVVDEPQVDVDGEVEIGAPLDAGHDVNVESEDSEPADHVIEIAADEAAADVAGPSDIEGAESIVAEMTRFAPEPELVATHLDADEPLPGADSEETAQEELEPTSTLAEQESEALEPNLAREDELAYPDATVLEEVPVAAATEEPLEPGAEQLEPLDAEEAQVLEEAAAPAVEHGPEEAQEAADDYEISAEHEEAGEAPERPFASEDLSSGETEEPAARPQLLETTPDLLIHLRDEVAFLRQQGQEKDRQIVAWINGAQWLQPFVDQIRSLEQQVERLGEIQVKRDGDRITDLMTERDTLRQRLAALEAEIDSTRAAKITADGNRRSWFRKMMGSD